MVPAEVNVEVEGQGHKHHFNIGVRELENLYAKYATLQLLRY